MPALSPQMREKLARSAFELFAQRGFRDVNLDSIAAQAGVTKGSLYWHYSSKKELVLAACAHYYDNWQRQAQAEIAAAESPLEQLERLIRLSVENCLFDERNRVFTTEIFAMSLKDHEIRDSWAGFYDTVRRFFVRLVEAVSAAGEIDVETPVDAVDWMLATIEGIKQRAAFEPEICTSGGRESIVRGLLRIVSHTPSALSGTPDP